MRKFGKDWESLRENLEKFEKVWESLRKYEKVWESLKKSEKVWKVWKSLKKFVKVWKSLKKFEKTWECLRKFEKFWESLRYLSLRVRDKELSSLLVTYSVTDRVDPWDAYASKKCVYPSIWLIHWLTLDG